MPTLSFIDPRKLTYNTLQQKPRNNMQNTTATPRMIASKGFLKQLHRLKDIGYKRADIRLHQSPFPLIIYNMLAGAMIGLMMYLSLQATSMSSIAIIITTIATALVSGLVGCLCIKTIAPDDTGYMYSWSMPVGYVGQCSLEEVDVFRQALGIEQAGQQRHSGYVWLSPWQSLSKTNIHDKARNQAGLALIQGQNAMIRLNNTEIGGIGEGMILPMHPNMSFQCNPAVSTLIDRTTYAVVDYNGDFKTDKFWRDYKMYDVRELNANQDQKTETNQILEAGVYVFDENPQLKIIKEPKVKDPKAYIFSQIHINNEPCEITVNASFEITDPITAITYKQQRLDSRSQETEEDIIHQTLHTVITQACSEYVQSLIMNPNLAVTPDQDTEMREAYETFQTHMNEMKQTAMLHATSMWNTSYTEQTGLTLKSLSLEDLSLSAQTLETHRTMAEAAQRSYHASMDNKVAELERKTHITRAETEAKAKVMAEQAYVDGMIEVETQKGNLLAIQETNAAIQARITAADMKAKIDVLKEHDIPTEDISRYLLAREVARSQIKTLAAGTSSFLGLGGDS